MSNEILYRFIGPRDREGKPTEYVPGIPAKDLTAADVERVKTRGLFDTLNGVAIYEAVKPAKATKAAAETKGVSGDA